MTEMELTPLEQQVKRVLMVLLGATALALACWAPWRAFSLGWLANTQGLPSWPPLVGLMSLGLQVYPAMALGSVGLGWLSLALRQYRAAALVAGVYLVYAILAILLVFVYALGLNFAI